MECQFERIGQRDITIKAPDFSEAFILVTGNIQYLAKLSWIVSVFGMYILIFFYVLCLYSLLV